MMKEAVYERLSTDAELIALLPGGIYAGWIVEEISRTTTPAAFDEFKELLPTGLLTWRNRTPHEGMPSRMGAMREEFAFMMYDKYGSAILDQARQRVRELLFDWWPTDVKGWGINYQGSLPDAEDVALESTLAVALFEAITRHEFA
jgi:hypothetical protein